MRRSLAVAALLAVFSLSAGAHVARAACDVSGVAAGTRVAELETALGSICIELFDAAAPLHVANFLYYADNGLMVDTFFHRSVPGFVLQGGGFRPGPPDILAIPPDNGPVTNEPCTLDIAAPPPAAPGTMICSERGNERGTVALAKVANDPSSGTTNWFINLADNRANLDNQNGGFTVFGRVLDMAVVDEIEALYIVNDDDTFWLESAVFPSGLSAPLQQPPFYGTPYGCFDPSDQASVLDASLLPALAGLSDPVISGMFHTVSTACGTPTTVEAFTQDPGPQECPDLDRIAVRTTGPASPVSFTGGVPDYVELSCEQAAESMTQRALWLPDYVDHFHANLVTLDVVAVPEPGPALGLSVGLGLLALFRSRRGPSREGRG